MILPIDIKQIFFGTLYGDITIPEFESWLYVNKQLETILSFENYLELISLGYKSATAKEDLKKILEQLIEDAEYEKWRLLRMLSEALENNKKLPQLLISFYELYCKGYQFLDNLGIGFGLVILAPYPHASTWEDLSVTEQQDLLTSFYPQLNTELHKVVNWLNSDKIIITVATNEHNNQFEFVDNRNEQEKRPTAYSRA